MQILLASKSSLDLIQFDYRYEHWSLKCQLFAKAFCFGLTCAHKQRKSLPPSFRIFLAIFKYSSIFVNMHFFIVMDRKDRCPGTFCCTWSSRGRTGRGHFLKERLASALGMPSDSTSTFTSWKNIDFSVQLFFSCQKVLFLYCFFPKYFHKINHPSIYGSSWL